MVRYCRTRVTIALACFLFTAFAAAANAQERMSKESVATLKAAFAADLQAMQDKYLALAQAFPQEKYTWRPMEGVRSVAEVLMLAAFEGYSFIPSAWGGKPADLGPREEANKLRTLSDKAQVIEHLKKGFAHAKAQLDAVDPATFTGTHKVFNQDRSAADVAMFVGGDLHEHLGQLIAYARMNQIVPPWSK